MKDGAVVKCASILGSTMIVCVMLVVDGVTATAAAGGVLATLTGIGGYAIAAETKRK